MTNNRFKELVHYVCSLCSDRPDELGAVKLNKVLWFADSYAFRKNGKTISGETAYVRRKLGPVPKTIFATTEELEKEGVLEISETKRRDGKTQRREFKVLKLSEGEVFSEGEKEIINRIVDDVCRNHTAHSISELSHDEIWEVLNDGDEIPIYTVLATNAAEVTEEDKAWAREVIGKYAASISA